MSETTTTYRVETVYALDDKASSALGGIDAAAGKAGRSVEGVTGAFGRLAAMAGAAGGFALGKRTLIDFNSGLEQSRITITGLLQLNHPGEKWADNFGRAERLVDRFTIRMKAAVGTTEDAVAMASMLVNPISAAGGSMKQLENMSVGATVAAKALNIQADVAARDVAEALTGRLTATSMFAKALLQPMGYTTKSFNALSAEKRLSEMDKALNSPALKQMAKAQEGTWAGVTSTLEDNLKIALGKVGLPLFKALTAEVQSWNTWLDKNQDKVAAFGKKLSEYLVTGFGVVKSAVAFLVDHADTLLMIGKVWAATKVAGAIGGTASNLLGGAGDLKGLLGMVVGKGQRDSAGKFIKGAGLAEAAGPVAAAAAAGWEVGRWIDEQTGAGRALVEAWDEMTGSAKASVLEAEDRNRRLTEANEVLRKHILEAAQRMSGFGGAASSSISANVAGVAGVAKSKAADLRAQAKSAAEMYDLFGTERQKGRSVYNVMGPVAEYLAGFYERRSGTVDAKRQAAAGLTDMYVAMAMKEMNATQRAHLDVAKGTNAVMAEMVRSLSRGALPFLGTDAVKALLLGERDKDAFNSPSKKAPNVSVGTIKVEVAAKDPDRWIQTAITKGLDKVRRSPTSVSTGRRMRGGL